MDFSTFPSGTEILQALGAAYVLFTLLSATLPQHWRVTAAFARLAGDIRNTTGRIAPNGQSTISVKTSPAKPTSGSNSTLNGIVLLLAATFSACHTGMTKVNWPELARCGPGIEDIIGSVSEVLLNKGAVRTELENLARVHGTTTVVCAVERLRSDWMAPGAAASPERVEGVQRATAFLDEVGTRVER